MDPDTSSLPYLLYFAWRGSGTALLGLQLGQGKHLQDLRRNAAQERVKLVKLVKGFRCRSMGRATKRLKEF